MRLNGFRMGESRIIFCFMAGAVFLCMVRPKPAGDDRVQAEEVTQYVEPVLTYEAEFALKSPANKNLKGKGVRKGQYRCMEGHWRMIDETLVFICD